VYPVVHVAGVPVHWNGEHILGAQAYLPALLLPSHCSTNQSPTIRNTTQTARDQIAAKTVTAELWLTHSNWFITFCGSLTWSFFPLSVVKVKQKPK